LPKPKRLDVSQRNRDRDALPKPSKLHYRFEFRCWPGGDGKKVIWPTVARSKRGRIALGVLSVALISYVVVSNYAGGQQPAEPAAKPQTAVAALGRIEPGSEIINLGAGISPDRLEELFVARGDVVKQGQVLARLGGYAEQDQFWLFNGTGILSEQAPCRKRCPGQATSRVRPSRHVRSCTPRGKR
jgi:hypothetical protein